MEVKVFCPNCGAAGFKKRLIEVDSSATGVIYPYCKGCKARHKILLLGNGDYLSMAQTQAKAK